MGGGWHGPLGFPDYFQAFSVILQLTPVSVTDFQEGLLLPVTKPAQASSGLWVSLGDDSNIEASACGASYKCLIVRS